MQDPSVQHDSPIRRTRLAPSPTGALHLGNARSFLINWTMARQMGWQIRLRMDDLEGPRIKPGADAAAIEDLLWLGLDWEGAIQRQSVGLERYEAAIQQLLENGTAYACRCTRKQVEQSGAGFAPDGSPIYGGTCRMAAIGPSEAGTALRFRVPAGSICFDDKAAGRHCCDLQHEAGDFVIRKADRTPSYQLASAVDDLAKGITHIIRGQDLLASSARQIALQHALGCADPGISYIHLPLVVGTDGRKLAKRHGDTTLASLRKEGVTAGQIRALLARWSGFEPSGVAIAVDEWVERFSLDALPGHPIVYDDAADRPRPL